MQPVPDYQAYHQKQNPEEGSTKDDITISFKTKFSNFTTISASFQHAPSMEKSNASPSGFFQES